MVKIYLSNDRVELKPYVRFGFISKSYQIIYSNIRTEYLNGDVTRRGWRVKHVNKVTTV